MRGLVRAATPRARRHVAKKNETPPKDTVSPKARPNALPVPRPDHSTPQKGERRQMFVQPERARVWTASDGASGAEDQRDHERSEGSRSVFLLARQRKKNNPPCTIQHVSTPSLLHLPPRFKEANGASRQRTKQRMSGRASATQLEQGHSWSVWGAWEE